MESGWEGSKGRYLGVPKSQDAWGRLNVNAEGVKTVTRESKARGATGGCALEGGPLTHGGGGMWHAEFIKVSRYFWLRTLLAVGFVPAGDGS